MLHISLSRVHGYYCCVVDDFCNVGKWYLRQSSKVSERWHCMRCQTINYYKIIVIIAVAVVKGGGGNRGLQLYIGCYCHHPSSVVVCARAILSLSMKWTQYRWHDTMWKWLYQSSKKKKRSHCMSLIDSRKCRKDNIRRFKNQQLALILLTAFVDWNPPTNRHCTPSTLI